MSLHDDEQSRIARVAREMAAEALQMSLRWFTIHNHVANAAFVSCRGGLNFVPGVPDAETAARADELVALVDASHRADCPVCHAGA